MERIWMQHVEHGGRAELPDIPYWRANGWEPCDGPPPEPDTTKDPELEAPADEELGLLATKPLKSAKSAKSAVKAPTEEGETIG